MGEVIELGPGFKKIDEKLLAHAVTLTAAFVANGDFRCGGGTRKDVTGVLQVEDMITTLYGVLESVCETISAGIR